MSSPEQTVSIGSFVKLVEHGTDDEDVYHVVENSKADLLRNKIPVETPLAQALLGKKPGDEVSVSGPNGELTFSVLDVERD